jgi:hypothetical protein
MIKPQDLLTEAENSHLSVIFHKVLSYINGDTKYLFFFEGIEDSSYYHCFFEYDCNSYEDFCCNGKETVLKIYSLLKERNLKNCKTAYFVDRDFDEPLSNDEIFETDCYSIENYYCNDNFIINLLKNEFLLNSKDDAYIKILELFKNKQNEFHESIILFNAWYYYLKKNKIITPMIRSICLEKKIYDSFINWNFDSSITSNYTLETIQAKFPEVKIVDNTEINKIISILKGKDLSKMLRGKYEIEFLQRFLRYIIQDGNSKERRKYLSKKTTVNFQDDRFITTFCQYAQKPLNIKGYLKERLHT